MSSSSTDLPRPEGPGLVTDGRTELREGYAEVGDVGLHYVDFFVTARPPQHRETSTT